MCDVRDCLYVVEDGGSCSLTTSKTGVSDLHLSRLSPQSSARRRSLQAIGSVLASLLESLLILSFYHFLCWNFCKTDHLTLYLSCRGERAATRRGFNFGERYGNRE